MSDPERRTPRASPPAEGRADEEFAESYADGYEEGLREAFREVLQHASRGHTAQELRLLIESRLARLKEDVEVKRRSLLNPPRRPAWGPLLRPPTPAAPPVSSWRGGAPAGGAAPGASYLFLEGRPQRAIEFVRQSAASFPRVLVLSLHPPQFADLSADRVEVVRLGPSPNPGSGDAGSLAPGQVAGRIREATERPGGALVYLDALETLVTESNVETALKLVNFAVTQAHETRSAIVVSADPSSFEAKDESRLRRAFNTTV